MADGVCEQSMEDFRERGCWEASLDLTLPTPTFYVSYGSRGEGGPVTADAGEYLLIRDERRDAHERGRKGARR